MSVHQRRIKAIQAVIAGSVIGASPSFSVIASEYEEVLRSNQIQPLGRRRILQVLHSTRALDSALRTFTLHHGCYPPQNRRSLGGYLWQLTNNSPLAIAPLSDVERKRFQSSIVHVRNRYMHEAGAYPPGDHQILTLFSEMQTCLFRVLNL